MTKSSEPGYIDKNALFADERKFLFEKFPGIEKFSNEQFKSFSELFTEGTFAKDALIAKEGDLIKSIYLIVSGIAAIEKTNGNQTESIAVLGSGEVIGMSNSGFYSTSGVRTATVMAKTDITVLELNLTQFNEFLLKHPELRKELSYANNLIMQLDFIRQLGIYSNASFNTIKTIAAQTSELAVEAHTILFKQGDPAEYCYFILNGKISIIVEDNGTVRKVNELSAGDIFGEVALMTCGVRNATATAVTPCTLMRIDRDNFSRSILENRENAKTIAKMIHYRSRPESIDNVSVHEVASKDGNITYILKDPEKKNYCRLTEEGLYIWNQLNGKNTLHDITVALYNEFQTFNPFLAESIVVELVNSGFIKGFESPLFDKDDISHLPLWIRSFIYLRRVMEFSYFFPDINDKLTRIYNSGFYLLYTRIGLSIIILVSIVGFLAFASQFTQGLLMLKHSTSLWSLLVWLIPVAIISIILHELGHAFTTKFYGREVYQFGVGWLWVAPRVMTNTSDMWLCPRGPRVAVDLAGLITNCFLAGTVSCIIYFMYPSTFTLILWLFCLLTYLEVIQNLNPFYFLDGYYVLMDLFDNQNLRESAITWLSTLKFNDLFNAHVLRSHKPEITYWLLGISFLIFSCVFTYFIQFHIFGTLSFTVRHPALAFILPVVVFFLATMSVLAEVLSKKSQ